MPISYFADQVELLATDSDCSYATMRLATTVGLGGIVGFLIGFALKQIIKILAVIAGLLFVALMYFQTQGIININ